MEEVVTQDLMEQWHILRIMDYQIQEEVEEELFLVLTHITQIQEAREEVVLLL